MNSNNINMTMRKHILAALWLSAALPVVAHAATLQDVWATAGSSRIYSANRVDSGIAAGSAPIEQALATLIPAPYRIELDSRVPNNWIVVWTAGRDWLSVLRAAVEPMGLRVVPEWSRGEIKIVLASASAATSMAVQPAATVAAPRAAPRVMGADSAAWQSRIAAGGPMGLSSALFRLLPNDMAAAGIEIVGLSDSQPVSWQAGSRRQALMDVAQAVQARVIVTSQNIRFEPAAVEPAAVNAQPAVGSPIAPASLHLVPGKPLGEQLREQGTAQGWTVVWNVDQDWIVPGATTLPGDFERAASEAIEAAAAEGAPLSATVYRTNHTLVITQTGVTNK
jgi:hypothetical protein